MRGVINLQQQPRSRQFYQVMRNCNFCILPSSSEGQSQSVIECMNQGLIPVVSRAAGLDQDDYVVMLEPCTIRQIRDTVQRLSAWSPEKCRDLSLKARAAAQRDFSEGQFSLNLQRAIQALLEDG